jgi:hypothetical protein
MFPEGIMGHHLARAAFLLAAFTAASQVSAGGTSEGPKPGGAPDLSLLRFQQLEIAEIVPAQPVAGQTAQVKVVVVGLPTPPAPETRIFSPAEQRQFERVFREKVHLAVDGAAVPIRSISEQGEFDSGVAMFGGAITVQWPRGDGGTLGFPATRTQSVALRAVGQSVSRNPTQIVEVRVPANVPLLVALGFFLLLTLWGLVFALLRYAKHGTLSGAGAPPSDMPDAYGTTQPVEDIATDPLPPLPNGPSIDRPEAPRVSGETVLVPAVPTRLIEALAGGQAAIVMGSGASAQAGLPTSQGLLTQLVQHLAADLPDALTYVLAAPDPEAEFARLKVELGGFSKVMDAILSSVPRGRVIEVMRKLLEVPAKPSRLHRLAASLPWRSVVLMAWDRVTADVFETHRPADFGKMQHFGPGSASELTSAMRAGAPLFLRPLGDLGRPHSLSLSMGELRRALVRNPELQRALAALLQSQTFLFVGIAVDTVEALLQAVAPDLEVNEVQHYALLPHDRNNAVWATTLARYGVGILPYGEVNEHAAAADFLAELQSRVRRERAAADPPGAPGPAGATSAEPVAGLRLTNVGPFETLELDFANSAETDQPNGAPPMPRWTVIFGGNGVGKSSILRSIGLVLMGEHPSAQPAGRRLLKVGASDGMIEVKIGGHWLKTQLIRDRTTVEVRSAQVTPVQHGALLVLGFSALRGARAADPGGPSSTQEARDPDPVDLLPLVDGSVDSRLGDFKQWLVNLLVRAQDGSDPRAEQMRDLLNDIIRDIVPGQIQSLAPIGKDFVIRVLTPEGEVPFDDMSQGMSSIFNWLGVLSQRLFDICASSTAPNLERAIVLVDEIDAHLHPDWQRRLVELTRRHFPRVQVIATSHSPLLAGALRGAEIVLLERDESGAVVRIENQIDPFGLPSQNILMSLFGMTTDRNPEVERLIRSYFRIFEKAERSDDEERQLKTLKVELDKYKYGAPVDAAPEFEPTAADIEKLNRRFGLKAGQAPAGEPA